jgi:hypothetical protein
MICVLDIVVDNEKHAEQRIRDNRRIDIGLNSPKIIHYLKETARVN